MSIWHTEAHTRGRSAGTIDLLYKELSHSQKFQNERWKCIFRVSPPSSGRTPRQCFVVLLNLFALSIDGIAPASIKFSLYVDDFIIYSSSNYLPALERRIQQAVNHVLAGQ